MNKLTALISATAIAAVSSLSVAVAAPAAPAGFGPQTSAVGPAAPTGFSGPKSSFNTVRDALQNGHDDMYVSLTGRLTNYLGYDKYEFSDDTGTIVVELDDDRNWSHLGKDMLITIYGELDVNRSGVEIDVKDAAPVK